MRIQIKRSAFFSHFQSLGLLGLLCLVLGASGCRSQQVHVESNTPDWMRHAERQLQSRPEARVSHTEEPEPPVQRRQAATGPIRPSEPPQPTAASTPVRQAAPSRQPASTQHPHVQWGERRITVEVEE